MRCHNHAGISQSGRQICEGFSFVDVNYGVMVKNNEHETVRLVPCAQK